MKRMVLCMMVLVVALVPVGMPAQANWWSDIGPDEGIDGIGDIQEGEYPDGEAEEDIAPGEGLVGFDALKEGGYPDGEAGEDIAPGEGLVGFDGMQEGDYPDGEEGDVVFWPEAMFDPGVCEITSRAFGNRVSCAMMGGWTIGRGYYEDAYRITAESGEGWQVMADAALVFDFVPAGDRIIYYGQSPKGKPAWLYQHPGEAAPHELPLTDQESVFYADGETIWYFTYGQGTSRPVRRMNYDGGQKQKLGDASATVIAMMEDGSVLAAAYSRGQVVSLKDGQRRVIYDPKREITDVISTGRSIWVQHEDEFGLLEDGQLTFTMPGVIKSVGTTTDQLVLVVEPSPTAVRCEVLMFNEVYRAWARVGEIRSQVNMSVELMPPGRLTVWGPEESMRWYVPEAEGWMPYGDMDVG